MKKVIMVNLEVPVELNEDIMEELPNLGGISRAAFFRMAARNELNRIKHKLTN